MENQAKDLERKFELLNKYKKYKNRLNIYKYKYQIFSYLI